jgi:mono/diheme cytochrome c family protein
MIRNAIGCLASLSFLAASLSAFAADAPELTFEKHVRPILKAHCFQCHGEAGKAEAKLDVRLKRLLEKGGDAGPAIVPGQPEQSLLLQRIESGEMPPVKLKLTPAERDVLRRWIAGGAKTVAPESEKPDENLFTLEERDHWAFRPISASTRLRVFALNLVRTTSDEFLLNALEAKQLSFSPETDRRTLIRRATFDLLGLPPTPDEVEEFVNDAEPDAYERLIDRLLASPRYGERWGRHWLDVAGYADSDGYTDEDPVRAWAFKYRDYVIRAFNNDKPFDEFLLEQLAGDELVPLPHANLTSESLDKLVATGFLRMAPDGTASGAVDQNIARNAVMAETIKTVATSLLGLSLGCAQCHDHRYEPITQADYYHFRAIFEPAYDWKNWRVPNGRLVTLYTDADRAKAAEIEANAAKIDADRQKKLDEHIQRILERELEKKPGELRDSLRTAHNTPADKRTPEQTALLKDHPSINVNGGTLPLYDNKAAEEVNAFSKQATELRGTKPPEEFVMVLNETPNVIPPTFLFARGEHFAPKQQLEPAELSILSERQKPNILPDDSTLPTSGRRLAYARWLTSGQHPLLARVLVNRVWMQHFGRGLVATPADFGVQGERPSHPALLDHLASEFIASGWRLKSLHRQLLLSTAYRQSSPRNAAQDAIDPDNRLLGHFPLRRLQAEEIRDATLAISGKLNAKLGGKPVPVMQDEIGQFVVGIDNINGNGVPDKMIPLNGEEFRRSLYVQVRRSRPLSVMDPFDPPVLDPNCPQRNSSTVSPQSLFLMNSDFVQEHAHHLAERVATTAGPDVKSKVVLAWRLIFGADPSEQELADAVTFVTAQTELFQPKTPPAAPAPNAAPPPDPARQAFALLCQSLLSSNRFLYVE